VSLYDYLSECLLCISLLYFIIDHLLLSTCATVSFVCLFVSRINQKTLVCLIANIGPHREVAHDRSYVAVDLETEAGVGIVSGESQQSLDAAQCQCNDSLYCILSDNWR